MSHKLEKHPTLPVIIRRYESSLDFEDPDAEIFEQNQLIDAQKQKVYRIVDVRNLQLSFDDMVKAGNIAAKNQGSLNNPNIIETLVIAPNRLIEMAAQGLRTATFGHLRIRAFRSMEEAIAYVEQQLKSQVS